MSSIPVKIVSQLVAERAIVVPIIIVAKNVIDENLGKGIRFVGWKRFFVVESGLEG